MDAFGVRFLPRKIAPLIKTESLEGAVIAALDYMGVALEEKSERAAGGANIDRLPQAI